MAYVDTKIGLAPYGHSMRVQLYFPTDLPDGMGSNKVKGVIWLLHGYSGCGSDWMQMTAATRYAADNGYILVAPDAGNSFYTDMAFGPDYFTLLSEALPVQLARIFHLPAEREKNFLCGLSMGGYGALKLGFLQPGRFAAIGSFSGAVDVQALVAGEAGFEPHQHRAMQAVLGAELAVPEDADVFALARRVAALPRAEQPRVFATCGRQDYLYPMNRRLRDGLASLGLDFEFREWDGVHEWNFWDRSLAEFIGFIQRDHYGDKKREDWSGT